MIKNSVQHAIRNYQGKIVEKDFPAVNPEGEDEEIELEQETTESEREEDDSHG